MAKHFHTFFPSTLLCTPDYVVSQLHFGEYAGLYEVISQETGEVVFYNTLAEAIQAAMPTK